MASSAGLPLALHQQDDSSVLHLSDSEDDMTPPFELPATTYNPREEKEQASRKRAQDAADSVPSHPIPNMQAAFAESLVEATHQGADQKPKLRFDEPKQRRAYLLDGAKDAKLHGELWRYRPGQNHHELWKLLSQISFGVYLLLDGLAKGEDQVITILQGHIDEVDEFLEVTIQDVNIAIDDVQERIDFLKLPMANMVTFEKMLEDRNFRLQIVTGNEKIEHIIARTTMALEAWLEDIDEGLKAVKIFAMYLNEQKNGEWRQGRPSIVEVFDAMKGNAEGWWKALVDLQETTATLDSLLISLGQMVAEMDQRAGEVSRRTRFSVAPFSDPATSTRSGDTSVRSPHTSSMNSPSDRRYTTSPSQHSHRSSSSGGSFPLAQMQGLERRSSLRGNQRPEPMEMLEENYYMEQEYEPEPSPVNEQGIYLLQPRTYTPQPPAPLPSPRVQDVPNPMENATPHVNRGPRASASMQNLGQRESTNSRVMSSGQFLSPRESAGSAQYFSPRESASSGQYLSPRESASSGGLGIMHNANLGMRGSAPLQSLSSRENPNPRNVASMQELRSKGGMSSRSQAQQPHHTLRQRVNERGGHTPERIQVPSLSPHGHQSARFQSPQSMSLNPDSAYGSDAENRAPVRPRLDGTVSFSPPATLHNRIPSPLSEHRDHQLFRPVLASPHSPLQRPWTSAGPAPQPQRPKTGMSAVSNATRAQHSSKEVKKKRSAFGWLKKAFTLDEEERAEFEAKKNAHMHNRYYEERNPKFLDGKRLDPNRRMTGYSGRS